MIAKKIITPYFLLSLLTLILQGYFLNHQLSINYQQTIQEIQKNFASTFAINIKNQNKEVLYAYLEAFAHIELLSGIEIKDRSNNLMASIGEHGEHSEIGVHFPLKLQDSIMGHIYFYSTNKLQNKIFWKKFYNYILGHFILLAFLIIFILLIQRRTLLAPMHYYIAHIKQNGWGHIMNILQESDIYFHELFILIQKEWQALEAKLDDYNKKYQKIELELKKEQGILAQTQRDHSYLYENLDQGIFTINRKFMIDHMYSKKCLEIYHLESMRKVDVKALLLNNTTMTENEKTIFWATIANALGEDIINYEFNAHLLPKKYEKMINGDLKLLEFKWKSISAQEQSNGKNIEICDKIMIFVKEVITQR